MLDRIVSDPAIFGGKPIIVGTRISVEMVMEWIATKLSVWLHALEAVEISAGVELGALDDRTDIAGNSELKKAFVAETGNSASTFDRAWRNRKETDRVRVDETGPRPRIYPASKD